MVNNIICKICLYKVINKDLKGSKKSVIVSNITIP